MKMKLVILLTLFCSGIKAQSTVDLDTVMFENKITAILNINSTFIDSTKIEIQYSQIIGIDTVNVFEGLYDFSIQDPSDFSQFEFNSSTNNLTLNLGTFDNYSFFIKVFIINVSEVTEEFILN